MTSRELYSLGASKFCSYFLRLGKPCLSGSQLWSFVRVSRYCPVLSSNFNMALAGHLLVSLPLLHQRHLRNMEWVPPPSFT